MVEQLLNHKVVSLSVAPSGFKCLMNYIILVPVCSVHNIVMQIILQKCTVTIPMTIDTYCTSRGFNVWTLCGEFIYFRCHIVLSESIGRVIFIT